MRRSKRLWDKLLVGRCGWGVFVDQNTPAKIEVVKIGIYKIVKEMSL